MKAFLIFVGAVSGIGVGLILLGILTALNPSDKRCFNDYWKMQAVENCVATAGCIYLAEDLLQWKLAKLRYEKNCKLYEIERVGKTTPAEEGDDAAPLDSRHTST